ncbi:MAG: bifunctional [glutamine synthetase] adenylyltransferase/[glutamine synthetase]-adenylyl-L-tyrosine phosphorylase [Pseudomonadota bacterium]
MTSEALQNRIKTRPFVFDTAAAARAWELLEAVKRDLDEDAIRLLTAVFSVSPYLARLSTLDPERLTRLLTVSPDASFTHILKSVEDAAHAAETRDALKHSLRRAKQEAAVLIALCDIGGVWDLSRVTQSLSDFADAAMEAALGWLWRDSGEAGQVKGVFVVAMGKLGAGELNYSSDIDLIALFDPETMPAGRADPKKRAIKLTQGLVDILQDQTTQGYVFRTDLRLRPDPGSSAIVVSVQGAERYYEALGQNWERAAFIKARVAAGDAELGQAFLTGLQPFIWRKHLDYAAISDIHAIKRQIHAGGRFSDFSIEGFNVKLGRGGIREIEFFAQTQQLILGGRALELRTAGTQAALACLAVGGFASEAARADLSAAYVFLRNVEHRLQMIADEQTHSLPQTADDIDRVARFMGYEETPDFRKDLLAHVQSVHGHYTDLFAEEEPLSGEEGSLVFTGVEDDPDTLETLRRARFQRPADAAARIRGWHAGRVRATRSARARQILTRLMPAIVKNMSEADDPDTVLVRFDTFLQGLPAGVQVFSLFYAKPDLLSLYVRLLGFGPRFGPYLAQNPHLLDAMLDASFFTPPPEAHDLDAEFQDLLEVSGEHVEAALDAARIWGREAAFRVSGALITGRIDVTEAGRGFSRLAETVVRGLAGLAEGEMRRRHGGLPEGDFAILALGRFGGGEMTATSDLDIMCVYDAPEGAVSDGEKPLDAHSYYTRLVRRLIAAVAAPTAEGVLYEIDMALRPSGGAGPMAVRLGAFQKYYRGEAWVWEKMALTRARVISGGAALRGRLADDIKEILTGVRDAAETLGEVRAMRARIAAAKPANDLWDVKLAPGGLVDIEFIAQGLQLVHAAAHPGCLSARTQDALAALASAGVLSDEDAKCLNEAGHFMQTVLHFSRLAQEGRFDAAAAGAAFRRALAFAAGRDGPEALEASLTAAQLEVLEIYRRIVDS